MKIEEKGVTQQQCILIIKGKFSYRKYLKNKIGKEKQNPCDAGEQKQEERKKEKTQGTRKREEKLIALDMRQEWMDKIVMMVKS